LAERNLNFHLTAKERRSASQPTRTLFRKGYIKGRTLDYGCGFGEDVKYLKSKGIDVEGYDIHYKPKFPNGKFDTIICNYVLNVLLPEQQTEVLMEISELLNSEGEAYFSVRRDLLHTGFRMHKVHKKKTYQGIVILPYKSILKNPNFEIYEYHHFSFSNQANKCPFCNLSRKPLLITESALAFAISDGFPVSNGHSLIIPKNHVSNYFKLTQREQNACWLVLNRVKKKIDEKFNPDGYNVGINIGEFAGQTIDHVHIHLIPRYKNDVPNPRGGVRGVIPSKKDY